ncbi:MAG: hypothetical protein A3G29_10200 [Burkholderiales bacterium RIFCSPLOWO2_12_FULL_64_99]|nr:MAG: hypothetical protein A3E52_07515 [Burkholderiales bacterium RIFCSPHIGHO2_12_FULL_63_20]OGB65175.1 MAG: hypothetical protein A3G29_10200 [Burkholderiales bacterium RIFCSPLOWO2_12_FULL_64_99]
MADRFNVVAFRIDDKRSIVVCVIVRSEPGCTVVFPASSQGRFVKSINLRTAFSAPGEVATGRCGWATMWRRPVNEPHIGLLAIGFRCVWIGEPKHVRAVMALETDAVAQRRQGCGIKRLGSRDIGYAECHMVKHAGLLKLMMRRDR